MKIKTKYFGETDVEVNEIIHFPNGIFGFEDSKSFIIVRFSDDNDGFLCLQSTMDEMLAFVLMNPFYLDPEYAPEMTDEDFESIEAVPETPLFFYTIIVVKENFKESTVNLKCPIAVNDEKRIAKQIILETGDYSLRHPIISFQTEV